MRFQVFIVIVIFSFSRAAQDKDTSSQLSENQLEISQESRRRRGLDDEDVINKFEMERVSPFYDIIRHLPPFDDNWIPNPVTGPNYPLPTTKEFKNESTSYGEFKIEVSKDEEHVVSESGRQFQENAALNWYYSAESYSSLNHHNNSLLLQSKFYGPSPKSVTTRQLDEEHVVSHVPSLRGGRGTFIDFNLIQSPTTPKVDASTAYKVDEPKPNITTRYILLQSGRIVAINVTSGPSVYSKPISSGTPDNNPFFFGSRIRNKNTTTKSVTKSEHNRPESSSTVGSITIDLTTQKNYKISDQLKFHQITTAKPQTTSRTTFKPQATSKTTIKPQTTIRTTVKLLTTTKTTGKPYTTARTTMKPQTTIRKSTEQSSNRREGKSTSSDISSIKPTVQYTKFQNMENIPEVHKPSLQSAKETTTDDAQRWWSEMKAAKKEKKVFITTNLPSTITTPSPRNSFDALIHILQPPKRNIPSFDKTFDSAKKRSNVSINHPVTDSILTSRRDKLPPPITPIHFVPSTVKPKKISSKSELNISVKKETTKFKTTTVQASLVNARNENTASSTTGSDLLEPPAAFPEVKHEFARILTLSLPLSSTTEFTTPASTIAKDVKNTSRRPRYRGLSHVNLQAPKVQLTESTTVPFTKATTAQPQITLVFTKRPIRNQVLSQPVTESSRRPIIPQLQEPFTNAPPRQPRNGFHLRNSVSFQTIPPGSLTDRRSLTRSSPVTENPVENLPPPIEDLLIISFEPTRKSSWEKHPENVTEKSSKLVEKPRSYRVRSEQYYPATVLPKRQNKVLISTPKPSKKATENSLHEIRPKDVPQARPGGGNRVGRHFRNNNSRYQAVAEKVEVTNPSSTTKQPYRVYYFEPKRRKTKNLEAEEKYEAPKYISSTDEKSTRTNAKKLTLTTGNNSSRGQTRYTSSSEPPNNRRQPKQLSVSPRPQTRNVPAEVITTPKPVGKRLRSSPFIWHRPNVGTARSAPQDVLIEVSVKETSSQQPRVFNDGIYRLANVQRTG